MWIRFIPSFSKSCYKPMVQYAFRNMNVGFEKARNQAQLVLPIAMARLLNVGIAVFETVTFAMSGLRSHVQLMVQMIASSIDNTTMPAHLLP